MRILLDTNVILDSMLQRSPWHQDADAILKAAASGQITCAVSPLSLTTAFYVGRKVVGTVAARAVIRSYLIAFSIVPFDSRTLRDADALAGNDFEDNVMVAAAVAAALDAIVTRNVIDFSHSPI